MRIHRGFHLPGTEGCALTIGNFDGVHRGHQAMLALLTSEARHRGLPSCVLSFEPHPRDHFARKAGRPELAPPRIATLRDKVVELQRCGIDHAVVARFDDRLAAMPPQDFIERVLVHGLVDAPIPAVASFGVRPTVEDSGRVLLEVHCLEWPPTLGTEAGYGRCLRVDLLHKLHDEVKYDSLQDLQAAITRDTEDARRWHAAHPAGARSPTSA